MEGELSDSELARQIATPGSDARAAEALLFRRFSARIELYGIKHLGSRAAAQDLVHEVLLRVLQSLRDGRLENPERLASFVLGTCRHVSWDLQRAERRQRRIEEESSHVAATHSDVQAGTLSEGDVLRLFQCLGTLPEREANVVRMSFLEDRAADEIGARLGLSPGNVRVIRCRALGKLASCMNGARTA